MIVTHHLLPSIKKELIDICDTNDFLEDVRKIIHDLEIVVELKKRPICSEAMLKNMACRNKDPDTEKKMKTKIETIINQLESWPVSLLRHIGDEGISAYVDLLESLKKPYAPLKKSERRELAEKVHVLAVKHEITIVRSVDGKLCHLLDVITRAAGVEYGDERLVRTVCEIHRT